MFYSTNSTQLVRNITKLKYRIFIDEGVRGAPCQIDKSVQQAVNSKIAGFFGSKPKLGSPMYHNNIIGYVKNPLLPFTRWASVKAVWCCQPGRVVLCIPRDYTDSS